MGTLGVQRYSYKLNNLDMIISVGYRVKSQRGIIFRRWANKVLKEYLIQGYSINNKRLEKLNKIIDIQNKNVSKIVLLNDMARWFALLSAYIEIVLIVSYLAI